MRLAIHILMVVLMMVLQPGKLVAQESPQQGAVSSRQIDTLPGLPKWIGMNPRLVMIDDTLWVLSGVCKTLRAEKYTEMPASGITEPSGVAEKRTPFLKVNGNIQYDFVHRSYVDTPFTQHDFNQHTVQASLKVTVKDKYPLKMNLSTRASNSPYFRNFLDMGLQFDQLNYIKDYRQQLLSKVSRYARQSPELASLESDLLKKKEHLQALKMRLSEPDIFQRLVEEREKKYQEKYRKQNPGFDIPGAEPDPAALAARLMHKSNPLALQTDSLEKLRSFADFIGDKKKELDSLQADLLALQHKTDSVRRVTEAKASELRKKIYQAKNTNELTKIARENGWTGDKVQGIDRFLANVRSVGIGRSMVSYSELTAWNISLTGLNLEYNNSKIYAAVAAGRMDYGFRDFFGSNSQARQQTLLMGRIGLGDKDHKALILSVFSGRKYNYGIVQADSVSSFVNVTGYSLEGIWKKDAYTSVSAELAKTTRPVTGSFRESNSLDDLLDLGDKRNLGVSIKAQTRISKSDTKLEGFLRKTGEHFQSFSLFTYNTDQLAWQIRADQPFWKQRLNITGMLRRNDFTHPFADKTFKTSTVFTSIQATLRMPEWPVLSVGYFPGTQLYVEDKTRVLENVYYLLNASAIYQYRLGAGRMISSAIYNRYSGKGTDSGFVAYSGANYMLSQSFLLEKIQFQGLYNFTDQELMRFHTMEAGVDYTILRRVRIGGGLKYNRVSGGDHYWGSRAQAMIEFSQIGNLQLQYDKSYLPTVYGDLFPVETGRVTWIKFF